VANVYKLVTKDGEGSQGVELFAKVDDDGDFMLETEEESLLMLTARGELVLFEDIEDDGRFNLNELGQLVVVPEEDL